MHLKLIKLGINANKPEYHRRSFCHCYFHTTPRSLLPGCAFGLGRWGLTARFKGPSGSDAAPLLRLVLGGLWGLIFFQQLSNKRRYGRGASHLERDVSRHILKKRSELAWISEPKLPIRDRHELRGKGTASFLSCSQHFFLLINRQHVHYVHTDSLERSGVGAKTACQSQKDICLNQVLVTMTLEQKVQYFRGHFSGATDTDCLGKVEAELKKNGAKKKEEEERKPALGDFESNTAHRHFHKTAHT